MKVTRPRGLCWGCFYTPNIRELYRSKNAHRGYGNATASNAPLPSFPTSSTPGSAEKMAVTSERAKSGTSIFHPGDATFESARAG